MGRPFEDREQHSDTVFEGANAAAIELAGAQFRECRFVRCSLGGSTLRACVFDTCTFEECDLSLVKVPHSSFSATRFVRSKLMGVNWTDAGWSSTRLWTPIGFKKCVLNHSTFLGMDLRAVSFVECTARDVDFRESDLTDCDLTGTDFAGALFGGTNLSGADLRGATDYAIEPGANTLKGARFSLPEAMSLLSGLDIEIEGWE